MEIKIEDIEVGDEILVGAGCGGHMRYLKVLRKPALGKKVSWYTKQPLYKNVICTVNMESIQRSRTYGNGQVHKWIEKKYHCTGEGHNTKIYQNLNDKIIWLLKRNEL